MSIRLRDRAGEVCIRYDANAARRSWDAMRYVLDERFAATP